jgi:Hint domain
MQSKTLTSNYTSYTLTSSAFTLTNQATVGSLGLAEGMLINGTDDTVVNQATITGQTYGINASQGVTVLNSDAGAQIQGGRAGVFVQGNPGTVSNAGTISATGVGAGSGVGLYAGGLVTNTAATAVISGTFDGVYASNAAATVSNLGTIIGLGSGDGGVSSSYGVNLTSGGTVVNGQSGSARGLIYGYSDGVGITGPTDGDVSLGAGTVSNYGTIIGRSLFGVYLMEGGSVTNASGGSIYGGNYGVAINFKNIGNAPNLTGTVVNYGTIVGAGNGVGVELGSGGSAFNASGGQITGYMGVSVFDQGGSTATVTNAGTITATNGGSGIAVYLQSAGDRLIVDPGAVFNGNVQGATGSLELASGASAGTMSGLYGQFGGQFSDFTQVAIDAGANWNLNGNNTIWSGETLTNLGTMIAVGTLENDGQIIVADGTMTLAALTGTGLVTLQAGGTLQTEGAVASSETIVFDGAGLRLDIDQPGGFAGTISAFSTNQTIDLAGVSPGSVSYSSTGGGQLDFTIPGGGPGTIALPGGGPLSVVSDGNGSALVTALCFLPSTLIGTPGGEVPVERLGIGDIVNTWGGGVRPVSWIGIGRVLATSGRRSAATPVIVRKNALADNVPARDLRVTKGHSLLIDNVLIPVEFLVNDRTILWDDHAREVTLYHVELDRHDVLVADGAPAESYRDDGNRWLFRNANSSWGLKPQKPCAPVLTGGPIVDAVWQRLLDRLGPRRPIPLTDDPDLHLLVDGERVDAAVTVSGSFLFRLCSRPRTVHIVSRAAIPRELGHARDSRCLGVALRRITVRQGTVFRSATADDARLVDGFHPFEPTTGLRWTDGAAAVPPDLFARFRCPIEVVLTVAGTTHYLDQGVPTERWVA